MNLPVWAGGPVVNVILGGGLSSFTRAPMFRGGAARGQDGVLCAPSALSILILSALSVA